LRASRKLSDQIKETKATKPTLQYLQTQRNQPGTCSRKAKMMTKEQKKAKKGAKKEDTSASP
jgi:hypothetical protein